jgi:hypothetical protein
VNYEQHVFSNTSVNLPEIDRILSNISSPLCQASRTSATCRDCPLCPFATSKRRARAASALSDSTCERNWSPKGFPCRRHRFMRGYNLARVCPAEDSLRPTVVLSSRFCTFSCLHVHSATASVQELRPSALRSELAFRALRVLDSSPSSSGTFRKTSSPGNTVTPSLGTAHFRALWDVSRLTVVTSSAGSSLRSFCLRVLRRANICVVVGSISDATGTLAHLRYLLAPTKK